MPRVTIGLPVMNGEKFLVEALVSICAQTFDDFELLISDNASTDRTESICREWAQKDARIHYWRNDTNVGAAKNFNLTVERASGEYFKWAAYDDTISDSFLMSSIQELDQNPSAVVACPQIVFIDGNGNPFEKDQKLPDIAFDAAWRRFSGMIRTMGDCTPIFGVMRRNVLLKTQLIQPFVHADRVTLLELGLRGPFVEAPDAVLYLRRHAGNSLNANRTLQERTDWYDPNLRGKPIQAYLRLFIEKYRAIDRAHLRPLDRAMCYVSASRFAVAQSGIVIRDSIVRRADRFRARS